MHQHSSVMSLHSCQTVLKCVKLHVTDVYILSCTHTETHICNMFTERVMKYLYTCSRYGISLKLYYSKYYVTLDK